MLLSTVRKLCRDLCLLNVIGARGWFDKESLIPGVEWDRERSGSQEDADLIVHLVSREILTRKGVVNREIKQTLRLVEDQPFGSVYAVFVRVEDFRLPLELTRFHYVDYFNEKWREKLQRAAETRKAQLGDTPPRLPVGELVSSQPSVVGPTLVEFSDSSENYDCEGAYLTYPSQGRYWSLVNSKIMATALEEFANMRADFVHLGDPRPNGGKYVWQMNCEEFCGKGEIVSVRFYSYYDTGGAHPNHHILTLNFLGEQRGYVTIRQLLGHSDTAARKVLKYCEKVILAGLDESDGLGLEQYAGDSEALWSLLSQFSVDGRGITINFSPYQVLPFVFGSHEVLVPWAVIEGDLAEPYRDLSVETAKVLLTSRVSR